jgi:lysyl-tRNA synthetase class 2
MQPNSVPDGGDKAHEPGVLNKQMVERLARMRSLEAHGMPPYPSGPFPKEPITEILQRPVGAHCRVGGRIMLARWMGSICFLTIQDQGGRIQVVISKKEFDARKARADDWASDYKFLENHLDLGDFVWVEGERFDTNKGEKSVKAYKLAVAAKALRPPPDKHKGVQDEETRQRQPHVAMIHDRSLVDMVMAKARWYRAIREFFTRREFVEVQTPVLETITGGADARPFVTHHHALDIDVYLRISNGELWQKRLMVGGLEKTFEFGRQFRNEGMSHEHLNDYDQVEFYWAWANHEDGMRLVEDLFRQTAEAAFGTLRFTMHRHGRTFEVDLGRPWERYDYADTVREFTGIDVLTATEGEVRAKLDALGVTYERDGFNLARAIDKLWKHCRVGLAGPGFLVNEPLAVSPLAKRSAANPALVERFHVVIAGSELGNGYSELNDPVDQAGRFDEQQKLRDQGDAEAQMYDREFVEALEYGMPPTCGFGMSERVFAFFMDKSVRDTQIFPLVKPQVGSR